MTHPIVPFYKPIEGYASVQELHDAFVKGDIKLVFLRIRDRIPPHILQNNSPDWLSNPVLQLIIAWNGLMIAKDMHSQLGDLFNERGEFTYGGIPFSFGQVSVALCEDPDQPRIQVVTQKSEFVPDIFAETKRFLRGS